MRSVCFEVTTVVLVSSLCITIETLNLFIRNLHNFVLILHCFSLELSFCHRLVSMHIEKFYIFLFCQTWSTSSVVHTGINYGGAFVYYLAPMKLREGKVSVVFAILDVFLEPVRTWRQRHIFFDVVSMSSEMVCIVTNETVHT